MLGGLILNAMPCVLPVLSLKLVGILQHAGQDRRAIATGGLATSAGIVTSFIALALLAIGVRAAGGLVGWGVQFQNPAFVVFLAIVVVLFCLNLWGVFEVPLPRALSRFDAGGAHHGVLGHFVTGLFATLMATPCSAPFLGTAVGFGLSQSAGVILAVFTAIGIGMALPYLFMAAVPGSVARLPRPGAWMVKLKVVLGFLLAGAAIWLLYVLSSQVSPERVAAIEVGLLVLSLLVWLGGDPMGSRAARAIGSGRRGGRDRRHALHRRARRRRSPSTQRDRSPRDGGIDWTVFDRGQAESLARDGRLVFVDVTADWCFTCKANERLILDTREVTAAFARLQVVPMRADWTNQNEAIAHFLADFGRYSIPFYLLYRPGAEPHLFPELLTKRDVLRVLDESAGNGAAQASRSAVCPRLGAASLRKRVELSRPLPLAQLGLEAVLCGVVEALTAHRVGQALEPAHAFLGVRRVDVVAAVAEVAHERRRRVADRERHRLGRMLRHRAPRRALGARDRDALGREREIDRRLRQRDQPFGRAEPIERLPAVRARPSSPADRRGRCPRRRSAACGAPRRWGPRPPRACARASRGWRRDRSRAATCGAPRSG